MCEEEKAQCASGQTPQFFILVCWHQLDYVLLKPFEQIRAQGTDGFKMLAKAEKRWY